MAKSLCLLLLSLFLLTKEGSTEAFDRERALAASCSTTVTDNDRFDCHPEYNANEQACVQRGCCWKAADSHKENNNNKNRSGAQQGVPYCYFPTDYPDYEVVDSSRSIISGGRRVTRSYALQKANATYWPPSAGGEILKLEARLFAETPQRLRVQIVDPNDAGRYQVPVVKEKASGWAERRQWTIDGSGDDDDDDTDYLISVNRKPFFIRVYRKSTGKLLFDTSVAPLIYADQFIQFATILPSAHFYGLGEHRDTLAHSTDAWRTLTMWNRDQPPSVGTNLYGAHPFYLSIDSDNNAFGFYYQNSNGMDIKVQPTPALTFTAIGGIVDFYIYMGPSPADVVAQHLQVVGTSLLPPYFALGFHLCRWKYNSSDNLKKVIDRNRAAQMPYDTQWTDIDAMAERRDWTYDTVNFAALPAIVADLHAHGQHYVNIIDPAISVQPGYYPYDAGLSANVFIRKLDGSALNDGIVWPGPTVFPDFTNPNTTKWWSDVAARFHAVIPFDGIWIDMNEPSNFVDGSSVGCSNTSTYDNPPYTPKVEGNSLSAKTICASSLQYLSNHYNLHNMYGHFEAIATNRALRTISPTKRPFVLSRSSFAGTGQFSAHWSGDNRATWEDLYYSVPNMLSFNMYGVAAVGSDICGFSGDTTEQLCIRWMQLGAFYPFMRNHNDDTSRDQDPAVFSEQAQDAMRSALNKRYQLLPHFYTLFYRSNTAGDTVVRPLFFEFAQDRNTHLIDNQFMVGASLLVSPVLKLDATTVDAYFPNETWYNYDSGKIVDITDSNWVKLNAPLDVINVHVRGGHVVSQQYPSVTTTASRKNPFSLLVALKPNSVASGSLFWDDGESSDSLETNSFNLFEFTAKDGNLMIDKRNDGYNTSMILSDVKVYGVFDKPSNTTINGKPYTNFVYDDFNQVLEIRYFFIDLLQFDSIEIAWN